MKLNVCADRLKQDYHIKYERYRSHKGRGVRLTLELPEKQASLPRKRDNHDDRDNL